MKICFWGNIAGALTGKTDGGGELQIAFIAKALAGCGHEVVAVDYHIRKEFVTEDGIRVYPIDRWHKGIKVLRTLTHRLPGLYSTLKAQKADIYYCRIRDFKHIIVFMVSRKLKSKFILHMASDLDTMNFRERLKNFYLATSAGLWWFFSGLLIEMIHPWLLRHADLVLVQHDGQKNVLLKKKISPVVFLNIIDMSEIPEFSTSGRDFIYVGWLDKRKGFADFFHLVERSPGHTFKVIGAPRDKTGHFFFEKLKSFPNVTLMGELSHSRTLQEIAGSKALISTSRMEGFPNVFLEAWACGIPVYSLNVDPGSVIKKEGLGVIANGNPDKIVQALDNYEFNDDFSKRTISYVHKHHALNPEKIKEIDEVFNQLCNGKIRNV